MTARLLRPTLALLTLLGEIRYTISRLTAAALLPSHLAKHQALRDQWTQIQAKEIGFYEQLSDALAQVDIADDKLDEFAIRFSNAVLALTGQKRDAKLYVHFFKKPLNEFLRPTLSGQLAAMDGWIKSLEEPSTPPSLAAMLPELVALVAAGKTAAGTRDEIKLKIKQFREVGERRQLIDQINAARKELHGALTKHAVETAGLPNDYANRFFKPGEAGGDDAQEETVESLGPEVAKLEAVLFEKKARLVALQKAAEEAAARDQERAAKLAQIEALNKEIEEKQKAAKALLDGLDD